MSIDIIHHLTGALLYRATNAQNVRAAVIDAVLSSADLSDANLSDADLSSADLSSANLSSADLSSADLSDANLIGANLIGANLGGANLSGAVLSGAYLSDADLGGANLSGANLSGANLSGAKMPGFADKLPKSLKEAALLTRDWLAEDRWIQGCWIKTPNGAYAGQCTACLHGAAVYVGGPEFGPLLSQRLTDAGYTAFWNDERGRTKAEVLAALDTVANEAAS